MNKYMLSLSVLLLGVMTSCHSQQDKAKDAAAKQMSTDVTTGDHETIDLPPPYATKAVKNFSEVIGWPDGKTPVAPDGFSVTKYAGDIRSPRWIYVLQNGDILVSCANTETKTPEALNKALSTRAKSVHTGSSPNLIMLLRGMNDKGQAKEIDTFMTGLNKPFGMLELGGKLYVANTDAVLVFPYTKGQTRITAAGKKIIELDPLGYNNHWTRNIIANADGSKIYVSVGSGSNAGENGIDKEFHRANILEFNPDGTGMRIYASGLRNPVGMSWAPGTKTLWTAVNERDNLGDDLVPDYITSVKDGGFYGWPFSYYGQHVDPRIADKDKRPDLVAKAIVPDVPVGSHTASLGLAFYTQKAFPAKYQNGAFIGQHGSWNRSVLSGYKVAFVPFKDGKPAGGVEDFLTGFVADADKSKVYGRPVGITMLADGSMLVADDVGDVIWRVAAK